MEEISCFKKIFSAIIKHGIPYFGDGNRVLYSYKNYHKLLDDRRNNDSRFEHLEGTIKGKYLMDMLASDFEILHNLKVIFKNLYYTSYERYTNLVEVVRNMNTHEYPMGKFWKHVCQFSKILMARQGEKSGTHPTS